MPLSQKQLEYLALAWQCFESEPKIDYEKFKSVANLASAASARELMRVTKKKLKEEYGAFGAAGGGAPASARKKNGVSGATPGSKRGRGETKDGAVAAAPDGDDEEPIGEESPMRKKQRIIPMGKTNVAKIKAEPKDDESEDDSSLC